MSTLIRAVNSPRLALETLTMKYLEPGHTSMSADSEHQLINRRLRVTKEVPDFAGFVGVVEEAKVTPLVMEPRNFLVLQDGISGGAKLRRLAKNEKRPMRKGRTSGISERSSFAEGQTSSRSRTDSMPGGPLWTF